MNNKIKVLIIIFSLLITGCATAREENFHKKFLLLAKKYGGKIISDTKIVDTSSFSAKKAKKMLSLIEHEWALTPNTI